LQPPRHEPAPARPGLHGLLLAAVVALGAAPRLAHLGDVPPALHHDEAATAADALELPERPALAFAHEGGGWVEGTYVWAAAPGLALARRVGWPSIEAAARLPAALAGVASIPLVYLLGRLLGGSALGLAAALCLAAAPWGWHFSHLALRGTLVPALTTGGLALVVWAADRRRPGGALAGGALLALAAATYPPARLTVPLLAAAAALALRLRGRAAWAAVGPPAAALLGLLPWTLWGAGAERLDAVLVEGGPLTGAAAAAKGYALHFSPRFLFSGSSSRGFAPEGVGLLPVWVGAAAALGGVTLARAARRGPPRSPATGAPEALLRPGAGALLAGWALLFPLAAAPTRDVPNALRAATGLPLFALLGAVGLVAAERLTRGRRWRQAATLALALGIGLSAAHARRAYFVRYPAAEARFYRPERRTLVEAARAAVREGVTVRCDEPFWEASLRVYGPELPRRRVGAGWVVGPGAPAARLVVGEGGAAAREPLGPQGRESPGR